MPESPAPRRLRSGLGAQAASPRLCPALAVPWRLPANVTAPLLTLYSVQSATAYDELVRTGTLTGDPAYADKDFVEAYAWMARMMAGRLETRGSGIVWSWARIRRRYLVDEARRSPGDVLLTLRVPRERVLVTPFDDWHMVLNRVLRVPARPGEPDAEWERRSAGVWDDWYERSSAYRELPMVRWPDDVRLQTESSWQSLFDPATWLPQDALQGTTHEVLTSDVVRAVRIASVPWLVGLAR